MSLIWIFKYGNNKKARFSFSCYSSAIHSLSQTAVMRVSVSRFCSLSLGNVILESRTGNEWQLIKYWHNHLITGNAF